MELIFKKEVWKDIKDYEGLYQVSNMGRVRSILFRNNKTIKKQNKILTPTNNGNGYLIISLNKNGDRKNKYIHRLVSEAFLPNINNLEQVNHIDFRRNNNNVNNLEWCTSQQNVYHSREHYKRPRKKTNSNTGERYITYSKKRNKYRIIINKKEYKATDTLEEAIIKRNAILKEVVSGG